MRTLNSLILGATALASLPSFAGTLTASEILTQFNAVITQQFSTTSDVEGRLVAGKLNTGSSATFYNKPNGSLSSYAAVNAITVDSGGAWMNVNNGGSVNYQSSNAGHFNFNADSKGVKGSAVYQSPAFTMADFTAPLDALQLQLSQLSANSTIDSTDHNQVKFNETGTTAVFNVTTAQLQTFSGIRFVGTAGTIIINVTGDTFDDTFNFLDVSTDLSSRIIWNFVNTESISLRGWEGSLLAGDATVRAGSAINGVLYAEDYTGNGELHSVAFGGELPTTTTTRAVVEPETYAMMLTCLGLMAWVRRKKPV